MILALYAASAETAVNAVSASIYVTVRACGRTVARTVSEKDRRIPTAERLSGDKTGLQRRSGREAERMPARPSSPLPSHIHCELPLMGISIA